MSRRHSTALLLLTAISLPGALPAPAAAPPPVSPTRHGDRVLAAYFRRQARELGKAALADVPTRAEWERRRPELRRQFLDMMGLWPLPPRTDLKATITGRVERPTFTLEKLHFQSAPGLYVTANLYLPKVRKGRAPAILYVCGHGPAVIDGVPHGNKVTYQHHPAWFAENGYVCLILDTLQLGELPGLHHGTSRFGMWWWQALGYTPAGVETWNAVRALDYLATREEVDMKRVGVTGRSGGGATSWWAAAADDRVACIIPVAGIADLEAHLSEGYPGRLRDGVIAGHCDCMYFTNTYRWDFTLVLALCAPRPLLLGNSDRDDIFPIPGYRRMADPVRRLYALHGAADRFALLETAGPHKDTPELRQGAFRWMNRWLKNDDRPVADPDREKIRPQDLKVFTRAPADSVNDSVHESFLRPASIEIPETPAVAREWWKGKGGELKSALRDRSFAGWPRSAPPLGTRSVADVKADGLRLRAWDFTSEEGIDLRLWALTDPGREVPTRVILDAVDEDGWREWVRDLGPAFREALHSGGNPAPRPYPQREDARFAQHRAALAHNGWAFAVVAPRGVGPTRWSDNHPADGRPNGHQIRRRFALIGQTLEGQQVWDVRRAVQALDSIPAWKAVPVTLQGRGVMAGVALHAALFEDRVAELDLWHLPPSYRSGPTFLNALRMLDLPQAVALALPRPVRLHVTDGEEARRWAWPLRLQSALGTTSLTVRRGED